MNQRKASAHYYLLEDILWDGPGGARLKKRRPMAELQLLAGLVWASERGRGPCPIVRARAKNDYSEYRYPTKRGKPGVIDLTTEHRCIGGLLHEMAHALGVYDKLEHGPAFRTRAIRLYRDFGGWNGEIDFDKKARR